MKIQSYLNFITILAIAFICIWFQSIIYRNLTFLDWFRTNFILLLVIYIGIYRNMFEGALLVFCLTLIEAKHSGAAFSTMLIVNLILYFSISLITQQIYVKDLNMIVLIIIAAVSAEKILMLLILQFNINITSTIIFYLKRSFFEILINSICFVPLYAVLRRLDLSTSVTREQADFFSGPIYLKKG